MVSKNSNTISFYYWLGQCFYDNEEYMNAIKYYQKALDNTKLYERKQVRSESIIIIGLAWSKLDEKNKAVENYRLALPILRKYFPPGHSNIQACEKNLEEGLKT